MPVPLDTKTSNPNVFINPSSKQEESYKTCCWDHREPAFNTVVYGDTIKGFLPAGSYNFTSEGRVTSSCTGEPLTESALYARTAGPKFGVTMGACVPTGSQSGILNYTGLFNPLQSTLSRRCYT